MILQYEITLDSLDISLEKTGSNESFQRHDFFHYDQLIKLPLHENIKKFPDYLKIFFK